MKILFLDQFSDLGGAQQCLLDLLPELRLRKWRAVVAAPRGVLLDRAMQEGADGEVLELPQLRSSRKTLSDAIAFGKRLRGVASVISRLGIEHQPDIVYVNGPRLIPALALARLKSVCVFHSHHFIVQRSVRWFARLLLRRLDARVIACCRYVANQWPGERTQVIYNGVAPLAFRAEMPEGRRRIGILGRVNPEKGHTVFVEAARQLLGRHPDWQFVVMGAPAFGDPAAESYMMQLRASAPSNIRFTGWLDHPAELLAQLHVLVVPSVTTEATTRVIPEAWAVGVPVVASRLGGITEIVDSGRTGFLVAPGDAAALTGAIERAVAMPSQEIMAVTRAARQRYEEQFTRERYAGEVCDLLSRLARR